MRRLLPAMLAAPLLSIAQQTAVEHAHDHPVPEKLGTVSFPISCSPTVQAQFNRAVALLHSFAYRPADAAFQAVVQRDPNCAMAHWGSAATHFHQLWDLPPSATDAAAARIELSKATELQGSASERERGMIRALGLVFNNSDTPFPQRAMAYETAMRQLAEESPEDVETQVFYSLALISRAAPTDREHRSQKIAEKLLQTLFARFPDHPGIPHYLIHACDNQELAPEGLPAARVYAGIAPSAPHALHMPSHIFTRLGLWSDSVTSNLAARKVARGQADTGEELHAMDYLVYAYLQSRRDREAEEVIQQLRDMPNLSMGDFKIGYAAVAMPVRQIVERQRWREAMAVNDPPPGAQPHVIAIAVWARGLGFAHSGEPAKAQGESEKLEQLEDRLRTSGNPYWAAQVGILRREVMAWSAQVSGDQKQAVGLLSQAANDEDGIEKLPVTPGPIVPAREQLGQLLLQQREYRAAAQVFEVALRNAPGRLGSIEGLTLAKRLSEPANSGWDAKTPAADR